MSKLRTLIIESNAQMLEQIKSNLERDGGFEVCGTAADGLAGATLVEDTPADVVILDIVLSGIDGFGVMARIRALKNRPKILVLSALSSESFVKKALDDGASYYMVKPVDFNQLKSRLMDIAGRRDSDVRDFRAPLNRGRTKSVEEKITNIFITVGIPAHIKGYQFLREAIKMAIDCPEIINSITKKLYPAIAERFETSPSKVERAIRHAIEVAWNRGKIENINSLFGVRVYSNNEKPTNGEFIALVADKMLIEGA